MKNRSIYTFKKTVFRLFFVFSLLVTLGTFAQTDFPDDTEDVPAAPIDDWVIPFVVLGSVLGCYLLKKGIEKSKSIQ